LNKLIAIIAMASLLVRCPTKLIMRLIGLLFVIFVLNGSQTDMFPRSLKPHCDIRNENSAITLIIPSKNRPTLNRTLSSLISQTDPNWRALVITHGITPPLFSDNRIQSISTDISVTSNHAGELRNIAAMEANTEWVGFVDDDDTLTSQYASILKNELVQRPNLDFIIFRMQYTNFGTLPPYGATDFEPGQVGISFAVRTKHMKDGFKFDPGPMEDFYLLNKMRKMNLTFHISDYITYHVRH